MESDAANSSYVKDTASTRGSCRFDDLYPSFNLPVYICCRSIVYFSVALLRIKREKYSISTLEATRDNRIRIESKGLLKSQTTGHCRLLAHRKGGRVAPSRVAIVSHVKAIENTAHYGINSSISTKSRKPMGYNMSSPYELRLHVYSACLEAKI